MRECSLQGQAEVVSNRRYKIHQTWGPTFRRALSSYRIESDCDIRKTTSNGSGLVLPLMGETDSTPVTPSFPSSLRFPLLPTMSNGVSIMMMTMTIMMPAPSLPLLLGCLRRIPPHSAVTCIQHACSAEHYGWTRSCKSHPDL